MTSMQQLLGKTYQEIATIVQQTGAPSFVSKQICDWIYAKHISDTADMSNISLKIRNKLAESYIVGTTPYIKEVVSQDGTRKYLFQYKDDVFVEAVLIFDNGRVTLCISTQAGCRMNCAFCATGKQSLQRNLTSNEIINIYRELTLRLCRDDMPQRQDNVQFPISNIVFMGMGEPLDNFDEVKKVLDILTSPWGYGLSPRRITVSTCGFMPKMKEFLDCSDTDVALSLHNAVSEERQMIMPVEKAFPVQQVVDLLKQYDWKGQRHLTFEYIVFKGMNDSNYHVNALAKLLNGLVCRINLIPFNTVPDTPFIGADSRQMQAFASKLKSKGFNVTVRKSKGQDISAACGLLSTKQRLK